MSNVKFLLFVWVELQLMSSSAFRCLSSPPKDFQKHPCRTAFASSLQASIPTTETAEAGNPNSIYNVSRDFRIFLRLSPLVGGPSFLPLHVEVILAPTAMCTNTREQEQNIDIVLRSARNVYFDIHRFDFLPQNPKERETIVKLMLLQAVPGNVRYRYCPEDSNNVMQKYGAVDDDSNSSYKDDIVQYNNDHQRDDRGVTMLLGLGWSSTSNKTTSRCLLSTATTFANEYSMNEGKELRILGGKNCLSFALDMLSHLNEMHDIEFEVSAPKILF
jgi:hypothetical protein